MLTNSIMYELPVFAYRGAIVESRHAVYVAQFGLLGSKPGRGIETDPPVTFMRSTAKPFQLTALLVQDTAARFELSGEDLALMAASHEGTIEHAARVQAILERMGFPAESLLCGLQRPAFLDRLAVNDPARFRAYDSLHHNCSGNHAAMLALAREYSVPVARYLDPNCDSQRAIHRIVAALAGVRPQIEIDNCGAPCYALPLQAIARSYSFLSQPALVHELPGPQRALLEGVADLGRFEQALEVVSSSLAHQPEWASGTQTGATRIARALQGDVVLKHGAEAVLCLAHRQRPLAMALKVADGNARALLPVVLELAREQGWAGEAQLEHLQDLVAPVLHGNRGQVVGRLQLQ